jgi:hypothetical protein
MGRLTRFLRARPCRRMQVRTYSKSISKQASTSAFVQRIFQGGSYGENLAQGYASPTLAIDGWANEESEYDYEKRKFSTGAGHFTQLVWKNTTAVGCGAADCDEKGWLLVCEYNPMGNVIGAFGGNVGKPGQGADGEPGVADSDGQDEDEKEDEKSGTDRKSIGTQLLAALVAMNVLGGLYT